MVFADATHNSFSTGCIDTFDSLENGIVSSTPGKSGFENKNLNPKLSVVSTSIGSSREDIALVYFTEAKLVP